MRVPVKITVDIDEKTFDIEVGLPTTAALIIKELRIEKGSQQPGRDNVGSLPFEKIVKIAILKKKQLEAGSLKAAVKKVLGTCLSMGVLVDGKSPKIVQKEIDENVYDSVLEKYRREWEEA